MTDSEEPDNKLASSLLKEVNAPEYRYWVSYYSDVTAVLNSLSTQLQSRDLCVIDVRKIIMNGVHVLRESFVKCDNLNKPVTKRLRELLGDVSFDFDELEAMDQLKVRHMHKTCQQYAQRLIKELEKRFPTESMEVVQCLATLFQKTMIQGETLAQFGIVEMEKLQKFYETLIDTSALLDEYQSYKFYASCNYGAIESKQYLALLSSDSHFKETYPTIHNLLIVTYTLASGSVDCERSFSLQNLIKTDIRGRMGTQALADLMRCSTDGPDMSAFNVQDFIPTWIDAKKRRISEVAEITEIFTVE